MLQELKLSSFIISIVVPVLGSLNSASRHLGFSA
ncbi:Auxin response factor [Psidium guajava]|nr:Auxin response factor [Psidium guajava]